MAKNPLSRIHHLSARIEQHLHQFEPMDDETDYSAPSGSQPEKKKKNPFLRAGMAVGAAGAGVAINANKDKIKGGFRTAKAGVKTGVDAVKESGKTAAFRGMRGTADVMKKGSKVAGDIATKTSWKHQGVRKGAASVSEVLATGAKKLKKGSMKFFTAQHAAQLVRLEAKFRKAGV